MIYECIGKCGQSADFETAPYPEHPTWPYLCSKCANEPARGASRNTKGIVEERPIKNLPVDWKKWVGEHFDVLPEDFKIEEISLADLRQLYNLANPDSPAERVIRARLGETKILVDNGGSVL